MNKKLIWLDEYNVGIDAIDQQHQSLFELVNQIADPEADAQVTNMNVLSLYRRLLKNLRDEEEIMKQGRCLDYQEHKSEHNQLVKQLTEIVTVTVGGGGDHRAIVEFMHNSYFVHILDRDMSILRHSLKIIELAEAVAA